MILLNYLIKFIIKVFGLFPIKNNKILVINFYGKGYSENPKYLCEELIKYNKYKIYWAVNKKSGDFPKEIKQVKYNSLPYFFHISTSKLWISNVRLPLYFFKRKKQLYMQLWHGGLGLKKIEYDVLDKLSDSYIKCMVNDNKMMDYFVSNSKWFENLIRNTFKSSAEILPFGFPKEDCLLIKNNTESIYKNINISNKKVVLYAPTFRNSYEHNPYNVDFNRLINLLKKVTNEEWVVAVKMHPNVHNYKSLFEFNNNVIDVNCIQDTQRLVKDCDLLISDYSSVLFDGLMSNIPSIIYAEDINDYYNERGFYFDIKKLPFSFSSTNDELCNIIENDYLKGYEKLYKEFLKKVVFYSNGDSSKKIANFINNLI